MAQATQSQASQTPAAPVAPGQHFATHPAAAAAMVQTATPAAAEDADVIEDAWVDAIKTAVAEHGADPYSLNEAISKLRADYMRKRYNKEIKAA